MGSVIAVKEIRDVSSTPLAVVVRSELLLERSVAVDYSTLDWWSVWGQVELVFIMFSWRDGSLIAEPSVTFAPQLFLDSVYCPCLWSIPVFSWSSFRVKFSSFLLSMFFLFSLMFFFLCFFGLMSTSHSNSHRRLCNAPISHNMNSV